jgi:ArsR family transcriptional regulator
MDRNLREEVIQLHANVCSGIADANRILLLYAVSESPHNVSELSAALGMQQPTVSRHLKILRDRGLVASHREGKEVIYRITDARIIQALDLMRAVMNTHLLNQAALAENLNENPASPG